MNRLAGIALLLMVFFLIGGCSSPQTEEQVLMKAQLDTPEQQPSAQKQPLSQEEVKLITRDLLDQAEEMQVKISAEEPESYVYEDSISSRAFSGSSSKAKKEEFLPVPPGDFDSAEKIKTQLEEIYTPEAANQYYTELFGGTEPIFKEIDGQLYYSSSHLYLLQPAMEYRIDSSVIMRQTIDEITVEMTTESPGSTPLKKNLRLRKCGESWRLDSAIFSQGSSEQSE